MLSLDMGCNRRKNFDVSMDRDMKGIGFFVNLRRRCLVAMFTEGITGKLKLFLWLLLDSIPRTLLRKFNLRLKYYIDESKNRLLKKTIITLNDCRFFCLDSRSVLVLSTETEKWMWRYLTLKKGDVFLDIGAHIGKYTVIGAKMVGRQGLVISVEPHPTNYKVLRENINLNNLNNVIALNVAAWNREGHLKFFIAKESGSHSLKINHGLGAINVRARPLDTLLEELGVKRVNYIKIDVEGAEAEVLEGLTLTLQKWKPTVIVEVWRHEEEKIKKFAEKRKYIVKPITPKFGNHQYCVLLPEEREGRSP